MASEEARLQAIYKKNPARCYSRNQYDEVRSYYEAASEEEDQAVEWMGVKVGQKETGSKPGSKEGGNRAGIPLIEGMPPVSGKMIENEVYQNYQGENVTAGEGRMLVSAGGIGIHKRHQLELLEKHRSETERGIRPRIEMTEDGFIPVVYDRSRVNTEDKNVRADVRTDPRAAAAAAGVESRVMGKWNIGSDNSMTLQSAYEERVPRGGGRGGVYGGKTQPDALDNLYSSAQHSSAQQQMQQQSTAQAEMSYSRDPRNDYNRDPRNDHSNSLSQGLHSAIPTPRSKPQNLAMLRGGNNQNLVMQQNLVSQQSSGQAVILGNMRKLRSAGGPGYSVPPVHESRSRNPTVTAQQRNLLSSQQQRSVSQSASASISPVSPQHTRDHHTRDHHTRDHHTRGSPVHGSVSYPAVDNRTKTEKAKEAIGNAGFNAITNAGKQFFGREWSIKQETKVTQYYKQQVELDMMSANQQKKEDRRIREVLEEQERHERQMWGMMSKQKEEKRTRSKERMREIEEAEEAEMERIANLEKEQRELEKRMAFRAKLDAKRDEDRAKMGLPPRARGRGNVVGNVMGGGPSPGDNGGNGGNSNSYASPNNPSPGEHTYSYQSYQTAGSAATSRGPSPGGYSSAGPSPGYAQSASAGASPGYGQSASAGSSAGPSPNLVYPRQDGSLIIEEEEEYRQAKESEERALHEMRSKHEELKVKLRRKQEEESGGNGGGSSQKLNGKSENVNSGDGDGNPAAAAEQVGSVEENANGNGPPVLNLPSKEARRERYQNG